jgi:hypothetical protein
VWEASKQARRMGLVLLVGFEGRGLRGSIYLVEGGCQSKYQSLTRRKESTVGSWMLLSKRVMKVQFCLSHINCVEEKRLNLHFFYSIQGGL